MSMWRDIKRGFGLGFGGGIGWNLSNFVWRWISRFLWLIGLALLWLFGKPALDGVGSSVKAYNDYAKAHPIQKHHEQHQRKENDHE